MREALLTRKAKDRLAQIKCTWYVLRETGHAMNRPGRQKKAEMTAVLPGDQQLPNSIVMSSRATSPQSQKLLHRLMKTTCNSEK